MENIVGTGNICLKMTSDKVVMVNNVLHFPVLQKNFVSTSFLTKNGIKYVFAYDKIVISKGEVYVGKSYLTKSIFKINIMTIDMNKSSSSFYLLESNNSWHERIEHVNYKTLQKLISLKVLPNFKCNKSKCQHVLNLSMPIICLSLLNEFQYLRLNSHRHL